MTIEEAEALAEMAGATPQGSDRKSPEYGRGASSVTAFRESSWTEVDTRLMEEVVSRGNMMAAYERAVRNKGAPGVDEMPVGELKGYLTQEWPRIKEELLKGGYQPQPVRQVEIPKPGGGMRMLGIPTVVDRLIQQALHQELMPLFDPDFSESSYGFVPVGAPIRLFRPPGSMWPKAGAGWSISTWRSSSTWWDTMCLWHGWPARSKTLGCCD